MQSLYKAAVHLLEDLHAHIKLLHTPERAQVLLAAAQVGGGARCGGGGGHGAAG
jgi:hypothetical protein